MAEVVFPDEAYQTLVRDLLRNGSPITTRNAGVRRLVCVPLAFDRAPLVCVRKAAWKNALREWEWFMSGSNDVADLHPAVRAWWEPWAGPAGHVYYNYSDQFRYFGHQCNFDQIEQLVNGVRDHPNSRRNVITTWNPQEMASPVCPITNCHGTVIQAFVESGGLTIATYQRSADVVCGVPHNWIQYWAFLCWLAHRTGLNPSRLIWVGGDVHLYDEHVGIAAEIIGADPDPDPPRLVYSPTSGDFRADDFALDREYRPKVLTRARMVV